MFNVYMDCYECYIESILYKNYIRVIKLYMYLGIHIVFQIEL